MPVSDANCTSRSAAPRSPGLLAAPTVRAQAGVARRIDALSGWAAQLAADLATASRIENGSRGANSESRARAREVAERAHADWAASGAMFLTGRAEGPPVLAPAAFATATDGAVRALAALCDDDAARSTLDALDAPALLGERGAALGLSRRGATSAGGQCRLLATRDGTIALALARQDDIDLLDAWLEVPHSDADPWEVAGRELATRGTEAIVERARLMGLACSDATVAPTGSGEWLRVHPISKPSPHANTQRCERPPLVVDLSSLWAGPLAANLLGIAGANVIKLESTQRPDGARRGPAAFYDALNTGKRSVALDFQTPDGLAALRRLIAAADIVIEASRPRALAQLGIDARAVVAASPGKTWLSITGYGRDLPFANWVAFGDDAAVAAGASAALRVQEGEWLFCGDALADPLTGAHAALAALASDRAGGGNLLELSLRGVTEAVLHSAGSLPPTRVRRTNNAAFEVEVAGAAAVPVRAPRLRTQAGRAALLGADTVAVLESLS